MKIKVKLAIAIILVIGLGLLYGCKNKEAEKKDFDNRIPSVETESNSKDDTQDESGLNIVEDEVTVDFGTEEDKKTESDVKEENTTVGGNSEASSNAVNTGQKDNDDMPNDSDTSLGTKPDDSDNEYEEPKNPYDKDGDGYVDGWY